MPFDAQAGLGFCTTCNALRDFLKRCDQFDEQHDALGLRFLCWWRELKLLFVPRTPGRRAAAASVAGPSALADAGDSSTALPVTFPRS